MKQKLKWDEIIGILFFLVSAGMLLMSVSFCFSSDIWYDELFTMGLASQSCGNLVSLTARDVHPPLYYLIVKLFLSGMKESHFTYQVAAAKLVSCLPFILCIIFSIYKIRKHFGLFAAGLFSFLLISMPQMADYTVEIRMYGFSVLLITAGMVFAYELVKNTEAYRAGAEKSDRRKNLSGWAALTICALFACYTHYFACVAACMVYLFLLTNMCLQKKWKQMGKPFLFSSFLCIAGYLPWLLLVVVKQVGRVSESYWIQPVSLRTLGGCVKFLFQPSFAGEKANVLLAVIFFLIYMLALLWTAVDFGKKCKRENAGLKTVEGNQEKGRIFFCAGCIFVLTGLVFFGMAASLIIKPVFVYRYMLPAMGVFWLAFSVLLSGLKEKKAVLIPVLLFLAVIGTGNFRAFYGEEMWKKLQMEAALKELEQIGSEDIIICNFGQVQAVASYYLPNDTYLWYESTEELIQEMFPGNHNLVEGEFSDEAGIAMVKELLKTGKTVWFFGSGNARDEILEKWEQEGIWSEEKASVMIERYWFNIYQISDTFLTLTPIRPLKRAYKSG